MKDLLSRLLKIEDKADLKSLLDNGAVLLDVRTKEEYRQGAASGSINIPLDSLPGNISKLTQDKPIIIVCASGVRSRSAVGFLINQGFLDVYNGGSWLDFSNEK